MRRWTLRAALSFADVGLGARRLGVARILSVARACLLRRVPKAVGQKGGPWGRTHSVSVGVGLDLILPLDSVCLMYLWPVMPIVDEIW